MYNTTGSVSMFNKCEETRGQCLAVGHLSTGDTM